MPGGRLIGQECRKQNAETETPPARSDAPAQQHDVKVAILPAQARCPLLPPLPKNTTGPESQGRRHSGRIEEGWEGDDGGRKGGTRRRCACREWGRPGELLDPQPPLEEPFWGKDSGLADAHKHELVVRP